MSDNSNQLAVLGQRVLDAIIASYLPEGDSSLALALHPGQALADELVQHSQTNPLRLSEWIADQYDYPLWLKRADGTAVSASLVGGLTAKAAYVNMVPWAMPSVAPGSASLPRLNALLATARRSLGDNPEVLPFGCEPMDFANPDSAAWMVFDTKISSSEANTTVRPGAIVGVNPQLWQLRPVSPALLETLPDLDEQVAEQRRFLASLAEIPRYEVIERLRRIPDVMDFVTQPAVPWQPGVDNLGEGSRVSGEVSGGEVSGGEVEVSGGFVEARGGEVDVAAKTEFADEFAEARWVQADAALSVDRAARRRTTLMGISDFDLVADEPAAPIPVAVAFNSEVVEKLATVQMADLATQPAIVETTTASSELHVHFEYCLLTITRRVAGARWWLPEFIAEDDWYVPGMKRGDMVKESTMEGHGHYLPQALLLVRNVSFTGSWTAAARESMMNAVSYIGPFLTRMPAAAAPSGEISASGATAEAVTVLGIGVQVIGELCAPLPPLPPRDDPELS